MCFYCGNHADHCAWPCRIVQWHLWIHSVALISLHSLFKPGHPPIRWGDALGSLAVWTLEKVGLHCWTILGGWHFALRHVCQRSWAYYIEDMFAGRIENIETDQKHKIRKQNRKHWKYWKPKKKLNDQSTQTDQSAQICLNANETGL